MSAGAAASVRGFDPSRSAAGGHNPWLIAGVVSIATFMEVLDTTIANVALRHIAGSLAAGLDQSTWVISSYLVSNAIILPISGWFSTVLGRKRFYMLCVAIFTVSSLFCGLAWSLQSLIVFRVLQGLGGGGMAPSEQAILADSFPPEKRGQAFAVYGVAVVVAPVIGPTLGGFLTDYYSWHWVFLINVPIGILSLILVGMLVHEPSGTEEDRRKLLQDGLNFDVLGFLFVALGLGCLEVVLDEGQRNDWFASSFISIFAIISAVSLIALVPWELSRKYPIVNIRLLGRRQFGTCFLVMLGTGAVLISSTQAMPQFLQTELGYTATLAGLAMSPGGLVTMTFMPVAGRLVSVIQPKYLIAFGSMAIALAMWNLAGLNGDVTFSYAVWSRIYLAFGLPFLFLPINTAAYEGIAPEETNQVSGLINVARNLGGSIGISMAQTLLAQRQQFHQSRLVENIVPSNIHYQETLRQVTAYFEAQGSDPIKAAQQAFAWIAQTVQDQAALLSYIDVFRALSILAIGMFPLAFLLQSGKLGQARAGH
ncbi:DHA2 family efflux MFS transporter permease subunit [Microvirga sp. 2TAF3]|uniref:DHA2 family efflux MFS transporter permease subunit n=1 Tax=Microvirga sp. 2TAF3 TaxID=3233014 RepID=UPI003F94E6E8